MCNGFEGGVAFAMLKNPITRTAVQTTAVLFIRLFTQVGTVLLLAHLFGSTRFGAFAGIVSLAVLLGTISTLGTHLVLLSEVAKYPDGDDMQSRFYALPTTLVSSSLLFSVYLLICFTWLKASTISWLVILSIGISEILFQPILILGATEIYARGRIVRSQFLQMLPLILRLGCACLIFILELDSPLDAYVIGYGISILAVLCYTWTLTSWRGFEVCRNWRLPRAHELRKAAGYAFLSLTTTGPNELDKTFAIKLMPLDSAGIYAIGSRMVGAGTLPVIGLMLSVLPSLFKEAEGQPREKSTLLRWTYIAGFVYSMLFAVLLWLAAPMFDDFFGDGYKGLSEVVRLLCFAIPGLGLRVITGNVLLTVGKPWVRAIFELVGIVILLIGSYFLVGRLGVFGLPITVIISEWVMCFIGGAYLIRISNKSV